jgi:hypothetical protein
MTERELQDAVIECAEVFGWKVHHQKYSIQSARGWPDLFMVRDGRALAAELKRDGRTPTPAQVEWLKALERAGAEVHIWRPADWRSGEIERVLRGECP